MNRTVCAAGKSVLHQRFRHRVRPAPGPLIPPSTRSDLKKTAFMLSIPPVIGHRGAKAHAPENTLASLRVAREHGVPWVEVDVKLTRDGVPILMHDDDFGRTTDGIG